ncbi:DNA-binding MarR family transcriptional regulator [Sphingopyxis italica]|uniref:DNA-binding MarR family transcriptional regulator n=1 Tax=Sphingopyxis italica TaxID=1129133 RepID=A0A7X6BAI8_9SPHN|nr:hypothetical protein [Sphingopyxis italica]NJB90558.1 DNA-binding MarR family transcriptional regulator [Sphingopyxis italica]
MAKGLEKRLFATVATKALFMPELTALDWRVLGLIGLHDGMTLLKAAQGKSMGAGCTASNVTLAREAQCSYAALCRSITKLERLDLIEKQDRRGGKGLTAIRVRYDPPDNVPRGDVQYDEAATLGAGQYDRTDINDDGQYDQTARSNALPPAEFLPDQRHHYSSLREGLDVAEAKELNSPEGAHFGFSELDPRERGLPMVSLKQHLPKLFDKLASYAQVPAIERAFKAMGGDPDRIPTPERTEIASLLDAISEAFAGEPTGQQAARLFGEIAPF